MKSQRFIYLSKVLFKIFLIVIFYFGSSYILYSQYYQTKEFKTEDGLPQPYIYNIIQDNKGFLWIGTGDGLSCYDGYQFKTFSTKDSLAGNFVKCSLKDKDDLWLGHMNGDITCISNNKAIKINIPVNEKTPITDMEKDLDNFIWASSYSGSFYRLNKKQEFKQMDFPGKESLIINAFKFLDDHTVLIGTMNGIEIWTFDSRGLLRRTNAIEAIPETKISDIIPGKTESEFLVATQDEGVFLLTKNDSNYGSSKINMQSDSIIKGVQSLLLDRKSNLWIGTFGKGLYKFKKQNDTTYIKVFQFNKANGYSSDNVNVVYEDREGIIWCGNYGNGLCKITKKLYSYSSYQDKFGNNILAIGTDDDCRWLGTEKGLIKVNFSGDLIQFYDHNNGLPQDGITAIYKNDKGIWLGTSQSGIYRFDSQKEKATVFFVSSGNLENSITTITGKGDILWVGTQKGLCNLSVTDSTATWYSIMNGGLPHNTINDVYVDSKNRVWVATLSNTISVIEDGIIHKTAIVAESPGFTINSITEDLNGKIYLATSTEGVLIVDALDSIKSITHSDGLFSNYCYSIVSDSKDHIWVGHHGGISRIDAKNGFVKMFQQEYEIVKNYTFNHNSIAYDGKNKVWFGFNAGMLAINTSGNNTQYVSPLLSITSVQVNDREVAFDDNIKLAAGQYKVTIEYIAVSLCHPQNTIYQYSLTGYDNAPVITKKTKVTYPRLSEGNYDFYITAINENGLKTDSAAHISIYIKTPLWKLPGFYISIVLFFVIISIIVMRKRAQIAKQEKLALEKKVEARTIKIREQKKQLEAKNSSLKLMNKKILLQKELIEKERKSITDSIKYAQRIQTALLPDEEVFRKKLSDFFILYQPKDIVSGDFYWATCIDHYMIIAAADCTGHGVPGAFMSMLGTAYLNEIVNKSIINDPDLILNQLRRKVIEALKQKGEVGETKDGLDIALCTLDFEHSKIYYAGAFNPLFLIHEDKFIEIKADHMPIGYYSGVDNKFSKNVIEFSQGDLFYIFSDGFSDQFNGVNGKKFMKKRFKDLLFQNRYKPMAAQKDTLVNTLRQWQGKAEQVDDILVIGVKF